MGFPIPRDHYMAHPHIDGRLQHLLRKEQILRWGEILTGIGIVYNWRDTAMQGGHAAHTVFLAQVVQARYDRLGMAVTPHENARLCSMGPKGQQVFLQRFNFQLRPQPPLIHSVSLK